MSSIQHPFSPRERERETEKKTEIEGFRPTHVPGAGRSLRPTDRGEKYGVRNRYRFENWNGKFRNMYRESHILDAPLFTMAAKCIRCTLFKCGLQASTLCRCLPPPHPLLSTANANHSMTRAARWNSLKIPGSSSLDASPLLFFILLFLNFVPPPLPFFGKFLPLSLSLLPDFTAQSTLKTGEIG